MKVGPVTLECEHCKTVEVLPPSKSKRGFMLAFNRFVRRHVWRCENRAKAMRPLKPVDRHKRTLQRFTTYGVTKQ